MGKIVFTILIFCSLNISAQHALNFRQVDTTTYQHFLKGEWKELIKAGKEGVGQGISSYYIQMRMAYAHFAREEYRAAIRYYSNALEYNSLDPIANEYLYYAYLYAGRTNDALVQTKALGPDQKKKMGVSDSTGIVSVGLTYSFASSDASSIQDAIVNDLNVTQNGVQKTINHFQLPKLVLSHRLGKHVILNHSLGYLQKNEFSYAYNSGYFLSPEQMMSQVEYGASMEIVPGKGWMIRPGFNFINLWIPLFDIGSYGPSAGSDRAVNEYQAIRSRNFSLMVRKEFRYFNIGLSYVNNNFNHIRSNQAGLHSSIYPLSNLNLYYSFDFYYQYMLFNELSQGHYIYHHTLGYKIFKNFWMEVSNTRPEQMNFYDVRNNISYNSIEKIGSAYSASLIFPLYKPGIKIFGNFAYHTNNSYFFPDQDMLSPLNKHSYNSFIITGGIKWTK